MSFQIYLFFLKLLKKPNWLSHEIKVKLHTYSTRAREKHLSSCSPFGQATVKFCLPSAVSMFTCLLWNHYLLSTQLGLGLSVRKVSMKSKLPTLQEKLAASNRTCFQDNLGYSVKHHIDGQKMYVQVHLYADFTHIHSGTWCFEHNTQQSNFNTWTYFDDENHNKITPRKRPPLFHTLTPP